MFYLFKKTEKLNLVKAMSMPKSFCTEILILKNLHVYTFFSF